MSSIKLILRSDKVNKNTGQAPLYMRIIRNRKSKFISLGVKLEPKHWDEDKQKVKKSYKNSARMNAFLAEKIAEAENKVLEETTKNRNVTSVELKQAVIGKEPAKFFEFSYKRIETLKPTLSYGSYNNYKRYINKLENYCKNKNLYFEDITVSFMKDYEYYLLNDLGNSQTTAEYSFRIIKIMFNHAIVEDVIPATVYPFKKYNLKKGKATKDYLNEEQFEQLVNYQPETEKEQLAYDMFVFACYAGGLRFFDVMELMWEHYIEEDQRIVKIIHKTKRKHNFKLPEQAQIILEKYKGLNPKYAFTMLDPEEDYSDEERYYYVKSLNNKRTNKQLHKIGKNLELPFTLTFHIARHTFATLALKKGMRIEYVSKILDHTDIQTTQVYAKIVNEELDKAMENVFK